MPHPLHSVGALLLLALPVIASRTIYDVDGSWLFAPSTDAQPAPTSPCALPGCTPSTNDAGWRVLDLPHDFIVEGNFSEKTPASTGYLPLTKAWYRKHLVIPASLAGTRLELEFEGVATQSVVFLNGVPLGAHASGYTLQRYVLDPSVLVVDGDNVLAVFADGTKPDGWWYDGGGIYRHVKLTSISTPGPYIIPFGVYPPSTPTGDISWAGGAPFADSALSPSVSVSSFASTVQDFTVSLTVFAADGTLAATASGGGNVSPNATTVWTPTAPVSLPNAALWHLVSPPLRPALYTLQAQLLVAGVVVDATNTTFGVRSAVFNNATGFELNGVPTKIMGFANHQDAAAVGVAVPDHLQWHRISQLKSIGANAWRTAHNPPNPALLDAGDELGMLFWDEDHRNGQDSETPLLVLRDRHHPCVIIWSVCNELLCDTSNALADATRIVALMKSLDPAGGRLVSANSRDKQPLPVGPTTPLDLQGVDYSTGQYDAYHARNVKIPMISSESSSSYSDRGVWVTTDLHVSAYNEFPAWGESAEGAWGGVGVADGQGIMTRSYMSGGFTWTGHDYRGEETPLPWPSVSSHFGAFDIASFPKDRAFYYQSIFMTAPFIHVLPHWSFVPGQVVPPIWVYSTAGEAEVFVNNASLGRKVVPQYSHAEWANVTFAPGTLTAVSYSSPGNNTPSASVTVRTAGVPASLRLSFHDGVGSAGLVAGCRDVALVKLEVLDAAGVVVPDANNTVAFFLTGDAGAAEIAGTASGDAASLVNNKSPVRPVFHGLALAVVTSSIAKNCGRMGPPNCAVNVRYQAASQRWGGGAPSSTTCPRPRPTPSKTRTARPTCLTRRLKTGRFLRP